MTDLNNSKFSLNDNRENNDSIEDKISVFNVASNEDIFIYFYFNEETQSIEACFKNKITNDSKRFNLENLPISKCRHCSLDLTIDNCQFLDKNENNELYCADCCKGKKAIIKVSSNKKEVQNKNKLINDKLKIYLEKNEKVSNNICIQAMKNLIKFSNQICKLIEFFNWNTLFEERALFLQKFIDNLSFYLEIVADIKMENLYFFSKIFLLS